MIRNSNSDFSPDILYFPLGTWIAEELSDLIGVTEDTVLNWEKNRTCPSQYRIILLKKRLDIDPFDLIEFDGAIAERQKSIINFITERGSIQEENGLAFED